MASRVGERKTNPPLNAREQPGARRADKRQNSADLLSPFQPWAGAPSPGNEEREDTDFDQHNLLVSQPNADCTSLPLLPGKQQIPVSAGEGVPAKGACSLLEQQALHPTGHSAVGCHLSAKTCLACVNATASCCSVPFH